MKLSRQMRLLQNKWQADTGWPKRLEWIKISGIRGWEGQRIDFEFPLMAISGENGSGKSTIIQSAASVYTIADKAKQYFASDFFPDTTWEIIKNASIEYLVRNGEKHIANSVRKPTDRWRGNPSRPERPVEYIDLSRTQPVSARTGYSRLAKPTLKEAKFTPFENDRLLRLSEIMGKKYSAARMSITDADENRAVPVVAREGADVSGYHLGAGEITMTEFLKIDPPKYSLVLIDEVETSLHPRAQRRLIRELADMARERELQIVLTTHSPYILSELPPQGRAYILNDSKKEVVLGVSPEFAMTKMDEEQHPECDIYVEDERARDFLREIMVKAIPDKISQVQFVAFGAASVGQALGQMVQTNRFPRPSIVFLDGDQSQQVGCLNLPGGDAPERVVFDGLLKKNWPNVHVRTGREFSQVADACARAMTSNDHHEWVASAANKLLLATDVLWQAMCSEWANCCLLDSDGKMIGDAVKSALAE
jgi:predicted ATPase